MTFNDRTCTAFSLKPTAVLMFISMLSGYAQTAQADTMAPAALPLTDPAFVTIETGFTTQPPTGELANANTTASLVSDPHPTAQMSPSLPLEPASSVSLATLIDPTTKNTVTNS